MRFLRILFAACVGLATPASAQSTRTALTLVNNSVFTSCGTGCITGQGVNSWNKQILASVGLLGDSNVWTGANYYPGVGYLYANGLNSPVTFTTSATAPILANTIVGNNTGGTGGPFALTPAQIVTMFGSNYVTNSQMAQAPANTAKCNPTGSAANVQDCTGTQIAALLPIASSSAKTTAYTVVSGDVGTTLALGGAAYYAVTFNAPGGYATGNYYLVNNDTRAKKIVLTGGATYLLWPGQSDTISNITGAWRAARGPRRYVWASAPYCYVDAVNGLNTDGLATGAGAFTTFQGCYQNMLANYDAAGFLPGIYLTATQYYTNPNDFTFNGTVTGSTGLIIYGNGSFISPVGGSSQAAVNYTGPAGQVSINGVNVSCGLSNCADFSISYPGELNIYSPVTFGSSYGPHVQASGPGSVVYITGKDYSNTPTANTIAAGSVMQHLQATQGGFLIDYSSSNTLTASVTFSSFAFANTNGILQTNAGAAYPLTLGGFTVTGQRYYAGTGGNITNTAGCGASYFPGSSAGSSTGGYCN